MIQNEHVSITDSKSIINSNNMGLLTEWWYIHVYYPIVQKTHNAAWKVGDKYRGSWMDNPIATAQVIFREPFQAPGLRYPKCAETEGPNHRKFGRPDMDGETTHHKAKTHQVLPERLQFLGSISLT